MKNVNDAANCQTHCQDNSQCQFWSYDPVSVIKKCRLHNDHTPLIIGVGANFARGPRFCSGKYAQGIYTEMYFFPFYSFFFCKNCFLLHHFYVSDTYKNNEYCYWSFYAPGAEKIILELSKMKTVPGDYMQVIGKGEVDYLVLEGEQVEAKNWTFESKYLQISWLTDDDDVSDGFTANIIRIG